MDDQDEKVEDEDKEMEGEDEKVEDEDEEMEGEEMEDGGKGKGRMNNQTIKGKAPEKKGRNSMLFTHAIPTHY